MSASPETVAIVGTGLIGASVGLAAKAAGLRAVGYDLAPASAQAALANGALDAVVASVADAVAAGDVVVIATPIRATLALLESFAPAPRTRLLLDVASVKVAIAAAGARVACFVAGHPIAGAARSGPQAARADLFVDRGWALVDPRTPELREAAAAFVRRLGARPFVVGAARHDALIALSSHLPQLLATAVGATLAERLGEPALRDLCGPGIRSALRLAGSPAALWAEILDANDVAVAQEVRTFADVLRSVADAVEQHDHAAVARRFEAAAWALAQLESNDPASASVSIP